MLFAIHVVYQLIAPTVPVVVERLLRGRESRLDGGAVVLLHARLEGLPALFSRAHLGERRSAED